MKVGKTIERTNNIAVRPVQDESGWWHLEVFHREEKAATWPKKYPSEGVANRCGNRITVDHLQELIGEPTGDDLKIEVLVERMVREKFDELMRQMESKLRKEHRRRPQQMELVPAA